MVTVDVNDLLERVTQALRGRGERMTEPRRAVLTALAGLEGHAGAEEVVDRVAERSPSVHRASVYRSLDALVDLGVVQHVHLGKGGTAYHLVPDHGHHLHTQCTQCGTVFDLPEHLMDGVREHLVREFGFILDPGHVAMAGVCRSCGTNRGSASLGDGD